MKVQWITHKGKKILFADYKNVKSQAEMIEILTQNVNEIKASRNKVVSFADMTNASTGPDYMKEAKTLGKEVAQDIEKSAIIGISGLKSILLKGYNMFSGDEIIPFKTKEEALDYLVA